MLFKSMSLEVLEPVYGFIAPGNAGSRGSHRACNSRTSAHDCQLDPSNSKQLKIANIEGDVL
jgi:hypothetical protein